MIEYLLELRVKDENRIRVINNHIFREKHMTREAGKTLEIIEYSMTEVN